MFGLYFCTVVCMPFCLCRSIYFYSLYNLLCSKLKFVIRVLWLDEYKNASKVLE